MSDDLPKPLRVLPGAEFTCHGDGLCCSDIHALGPVTDQEAELLVALHPGTVTMHGEDRVLTYKEDGTCLFLGAEGHCALHAQLGPRSKPKTCRQFPFRLVATPDGTRLTTPHVCPCRTLGERAPLTPEAVSPVDHTRPDRVVRETLPLDADTEMTMAEWGAREAEVLRRIEGEDPVEVLGGAVIDASWSEVLEELLALTTTDRFSVALRCFAGAVVDRDDLPRPHWSAAFDRAEARSEQVRDPEQMLREWVREELWSLEWAFRGTWVQARRELAVRVSVARRLASRFDGRDDRTMAEAISIVDLVGLADLYRDFVRTLPS